MKFLKWFLIILVVVAFISVCSEEIGGDKEADTTESKSEQAKDYSNLVTPITQNGYPKTYNAWGEQWIGDINKAMPVAINHIAKNDKCDEPVDVGLSQGRSKPQHEAVFYVDCKNGERFYINQTQLNNNAEVKAESEKKADAAETAKPKDIMTIQQRNAVRSAKQYLSFKGFSRDGLIEQLSSEYGDGYSKEDATIAVDSLNVDWSEQAVKAAQAYLEFKGFSCKGLIQQLSSSAGEKFTKEQAEYGAKGAGVCN